jgi:signal transduction histidine kinase
MQSTMSELDQLPNLEAYMDRTSALELARRSLLGAPVYTVISLIMLAGTPMLMDYGRLAAVEGALLILLGCVRVWFALNFERRYDQVDERAVIEFSILTAIQSLTLGVLSAIVIWQYWAAQQVVMTIVLSAGCIAAGTSALSVRRSAQLIFLACVLAPFGISVYFAGGLAQAALIVGFLSLMAFLVQDGGQAKGAYFQRLKEHYTEEISRRRSALEIQARQEFLSDISHDIRAPVNSIIGMTALLLDERLGRRSREIAETIRKSTNSLLNKIGNIPGSINTNHSTAELQVGDWIFPGVSARS